MNQADLNDEMDSISSSEVRAKFEAYPGKALLSMLSMRRLILDTASGDPAIGNVEETLKWGEPSYMAKGGSTLRIDWKAKEPDQYAMYFNCQTKLVETFEKLYGDLFRFEGNRAIVFGLEENLPVPELKQCIVSTLRYHRVKRLPLLGMR